MNQERVTLPDDPPRREREQPGPPEGCPGQGAFLVWVVARYTRDEGHVSELNEILWAGWSDRRVGHW